MFTLNFLLESNMHEGVIMTKNLQNYLSFTLTFQLQIPITLKPDLILSLLSSSRSQSLQLQTLNSFTLTFQLLFSTVGARSTNGEKKSPRMISNFKFLLFLVPLQSSSWKINRQVGRGKGCNVIRNSN
jgi:hypothetical protein